jgi:DNA-binding CsgD family transcriptional regulator
LLSRLAAAAVEAADQPAFRQRALELVGSDVGADRGLFHALSPRVPLDTMATWGVARADVERTLPSWDDLAVHLEGFFTVAARQGGLACDDEALPANSAARRLFVQRIGRPLGLQTLAILHLSLPVALEPAAAAEPVVGSALVLGRRRARPFSASERARLRAAIPVLALGDALWARRTPGPLPGRRSRLVCLDSRLTPRQRACVELVARGRTNREIAVALGVSEHGVRNHLARIFARLGAANRADLVRLAVLQPPAPLGTKVPKTPSRRGRRSRA